MVEKGKKDDIKSSNLEWLDKYSTSANDIISLFHEDFAAIKKTLIDKNKNKLENGADAQWYAKRVAKYIFQSVTRSMENLFDLRLEIIKEVRDRQLSNDDWLTEKSHVILKSNASNGKVEVHFDSSLSSNAKIVENEELKSHLPSIDNNISQNGIDVGDEEELQESGTNNDVLNEVIVEEMEIPRTSNVVEDNSKVKSTNKAVCQESKSNDLESKEQEGPTPLTDHYNQSVQPVVEPSENCDISSAQTPKVLSKCKEVVDDQVPGPSRLSHLSTRRMARAKKREFEKVIIIDSSDTDYEEPTPTVKKTRSSKVATAVNKNKVAPRPKSKQTVSTRRGPTTADKDSIKSKKQVSISDKSDSSYEENKPNTRKKSIKSSKDKANDDSKDLTKNEVIITPSPLAEKCVTSPEAEKTEILNKEIMKIKQGTKKVDDDYWRNHDVKNDEKLQNLGKVKVVLEKLNKGMEEKLKIVGKRAVPKNLE